VSSVIVWDC